MSGCMTWLDWLYRGTSGFVFACVCLLALVIITFTYIARYEKERAKREDILDKQELYRRMRADKWSRIADGLAEREDV